MRPSLAAVLGAVLVGAVSLQAKADVTGPFPGVILNKHGDRALVVADLCAPGVSVRATKYAERKATPEQWATNPAVNADVAVNGDFFDFPGWTYVVGRARGAGEDWPANEQNRENREYWQFGPAMADLIAPASTPPDPGATEILGGHNIVIKGGVSQGPNFDGDGVILESARRTGIGLSASRSRVYLFSSNTALDGNAMAASMLQMAAEAGQPDLDVATNQDGGGSAQMYVRGQGQIVDSGRQVNNHLGILAKGSGAAPMCRVRPPTLTVPPLAGACGTIKPGEGLGKTHTVSSCDGRFTLNLQADGNLVLYAPDEKVAWSTGSFGGREGYALAMQGDGNLVLYGPYGEVRWQSNTPGHPGAYLAVQTDGNLVVYQGSTALWGSATNTASAPTVRTLGPVTQAKTCGKVASGEGLAKGTKIASCDGRFALAQQSDGNLVLSETAGKVLWSAQTTAGVGNQFVMQSDGNAVVYTAFSNYVWTSSTGGHPGAYLAIQNDGNLVLYAGSTALWNSGTLDRNAPAAPKNTGGAAGAGNEGAGGVGAAGSGVAHAGGTAAAGSGGASSSFGGTSAFGGTGGSSQGGGQGARGAQDDQASSSDSGGCSLRPAGSPPGVRWLASLLAVATAWRVGRRRSMER